MTSTAHEELSSAEAAAQIQAQAFEGLKRIGHYELSKKLGQGGMGAVFLALDSRLKRNVALKILPKEKAENPTLVRRFKAEAQNAAQLKHDNIVDIYETGEADGFLYIALEFIDGIDAHDLVTRRGVIPVKRSIDIVKQVARALQHAYEKNIVHRDIKPANLLIRRDGVVKLADMGLARAVDEETETSITRAGCTVGTVDYMSPEQARDSKSADTRSDLYSLGCTWYHLLTGQPPFSDGSLTNKLRAHAQQPPPDPRALNERIPEGVVAVMHRMMAKNPDQRYQSPADLLEDLDKPITRDIVSQKLFEDIETTTPSAPPPSGKPKSGGGSGSTGTTGSSSGSGTRMTIPLDDDDEEDLSEEDLTRSDAPQPPTSKKSSQKDQKETPRARSTVADRSASTAAGTEDVQVGGHDEPDAPARKKGKRRSVEARDESEAASGHGTTGRQRSADADTTDLPQKSYKLPPKVHRDGTIQETPARETPVWLKQARPFLIAGGIVIGVVLLLYIVSLAQNYGNAVNIQPVGPAGNPFDNAPPPPPSTTLTPTGTGPVAGAETPGDPAAQSKTDVLTATGEPGNPLGANTGPNSGQTTVLTPSGTVPGTTGPANPLPAWVETPPALSTLPVLSVRSGGKISPADRQYNSLESALQGVPPTGASILLFDDGPFPLSATELTTQRLSIRAAAGAKPVIQSVAHAMQRGKPLLAVQGGSLLLDDVHVRADAAAEPGNEPWSLFRVTGGELWVRSSSIQLVGSRPGPTVVARIDGQATLEGQPTETHVLFDKSTIRGSGLTALQMDAPRWDAVIHHSLVANSGPAPLFMINSREKAEVGAWRRLFALESTLSAGDRLIRASATGNTNPIELQLQSLASLLASSEDKEENALLETVDWPRKGSSGSALKNLTWAAGGTGLLGWRTLLKVTGEQNADLKEIGDWRKFWRESPENTLISTAPWPVKTSTPLPEQPLTNWAQTSLIDTIPNLLIAGIKPGCDVAELVLNNSTAPSAASIAGRMPSAPLPFNSRSTVTVDAARQDLGKFVASKKWEDGTTFLVQGSGSRQSSPLVIEGNRLQFVFQQLDGPPFIITPKQGSLRGSQDSSFITLRNGHIDLQHLTFQTAPSDQTTVPNWFLSAEGGSFTLRNCRIQVPQSAGQKVKGLIRWTGTTGTPAAGDEFAATSLIQDSLLSSLGTIVSTELDGRALLVLNSVLFSRQQLLEVQVGQGSNHPSALAIQHCTLASAGNFLNFRSVRPAGKPGPACRISVTDSICTPPLLDGVAKVTPVLFTYQGDLPLPQQVAWSESKNAYSQQLKSFLIQAKNGTTAPSSAAQDFQKDWASVWGMDQVREPLLGQDAVIFDNPLPVIPFLRPAHFTLHRTAKARTAGAAGQSLGARLALLEPPGAQPKTAPVQKPGTSKKTVVPRPGF